MCGGVPLTRRSSAVAASLGVAFVDDVESFTWQLLAQLQTVARVARRLLASGVDACAVTPAA